MFLLKGQGIARQRVHDYANHVSPIRVIDTTSRDFMDKKGIEDDELAGRYSEGGNVQRHNDLDGNSKHVTPERTQTCVCAA
ncbi:hypothetical protein V3C99_004785 [Haemonchus contortus]